MNCTAGLTRGSFNLYIMVGQDVSHLNHAGLDAVHQFPRVIEFPSATYADAVGPFLDGEDTAQLGVMTAKQRLEYPRYRPSHKRNDLSKQLKRKE
jgi:hypothetical protein